MMKNRVCGITLLFASEQDSSSLVEAQLKSYVVQLADWKSLNCIAKDIANDVCKKAFANENIKYLGIEDIFYVSGIFNQFEILGKSFIPECNTIKKAQELLIEEELYACNKFELSSSSKWYLVSLLYFYHDKDIKDKLTISCSTPIYSKSIKDIKELVLKTANKEAFVNKIVTESLDEMNFRYLKYIGIENIHLITENPNDNGAFQVLYKDFNNIQEIKNILPKESDLKKSLLLIMKKGYPTINQSYNH